MRHRWLSGALGLLAVAMLGVGCADDRPPQSAVEPGEVEVVTAQGLPARGGAVHLGGDRWATAAHVVRDTTDMTLVHEGRRVDARLVEFDERTDLAVLSTPTLRLSTRMLMGGGDAGVPAEVLAPTGARPVRLGEPVRVRVLAVDGTSREWDGLALLDPVGPGDSGSPVVQGGVVVGIVVLADVHRPRGFAVASSELENLLFTLG